MYTKAKSKFVKSMIKKTNWKNREYIDDLLFIEKWISGKATGMGAGYRWVQFTENKYPKEIQEIGIELNPKNYKDFCKRQLLEKARMKKDEKKFLKKQKEKEHREREDWNKAGGKP